MGFATGSKRERNLTLFGAATNLILVGTAEKMRLTIRLGEFVRPGLPLAALTIGASWFRSILASSGADL
jgi:Na+/H+ antiporter NhaD/arsenite permease-like protein